LPGTEISRRVTVADPDFPSDLNMSGGCFVHERPTGEGIRSVGWLPFPLKAGGRNV